MYPGYWDEYEERMGGDEDKNDKGHHGKGRSLKEKYKEIKAERDAVVAERNALWEASRANARRFRNERRARRELEERQKKLWNLLRTVF